MREIKIMGKMVQVRGIMRSEIEEMAQKGYPISRWGIGIDVEADREIVDKMFEEVLTTGVLPDLGLDLMTLTPADEHKLFTAIVAETYGSGEEEKNSSRSGNGTQTENEETIV
jgi:hypothetical protein